jgi:hypothetical protein
MKTPFQAAEKDHMLRCARSSHSNAAMGIASLHPSYSSGSAKGMGELVLSEAEGSISRAPRLWFFLSSLQEFFQHQKKTVILQNLGGPP